MFNTSRKINRLSKRVEEANTPELDEAGRPIIHITVADDSHFISPYSTANAPQLTHETAEFLEHSIKHLKNDNQIKFVISGKTIDENEKVIYKRAIRNYYMQEIAETKSELKHNSAISILMTFIGIIVFSIGLLLNHYNIFPLILSIVDVVAWVFVWEAVDVFFFRRSALRAEQLKYLKILTAEIDFI